MKKITFGILFIWTLFPFSATLAEEIMRDIVFPVDGKNTFTDTWGDSRSGGRSHIGTDIITDKHTPLLAAVDGRVSYVTEIEKDWGYALYIEDSEGYSYRYLHINNDTPGTDDGNGGYANAFAPGIERGARVTAGQVVAYAGDSGNAESVGSHLHFEIWTPAHEPVNSYPSLIAALYDDVPAWQYYFARDLDLGDTGQDVYELQRYLNVNGYTVAASGAGSRGNETQYFGPATQVALQEFQIAYGLPAYGYFGPQTRTLINSGQGNAVAQTAPLEPGWLIKNKQFAEVFYVTDEYQLRWIINEAAAEKHFGPTWNQDIHEFDSLEEFSVHFGKNLE